MPHHLRNRWSGQWRTTRQPYAHTGSLLASAAQESDHSDDEYRCARESHFETLLSPVGDRNWLAETRRVPIGPRFQSQQIAGDRTLAETYGEALRATGAANAYWGGPSRDPNHFDVDPILYDPDERPTELSHRVHSVSTGPGRRVRVHHVVRGIELPEELVDLSRYSNGYANISPEVSDSGEDAGVSGDETDGDEAGNDESNADEPNARADEGWQRFLETRPAEHQDFYHLVSQQGSEEAITDLTNTDLGMSIIQSNFELACSMMPPLP